MHFDPDPVSAFAGCEDVLFNIQRHFGAVNFQNGTICQGRAILRLSHNTAADRGADGCAFSIGRAGNAAGRVSSLCTYIAADVNIHNAVARDNSISRLVLRIKSLVIACIGHYTDRHISGRGDIPPDNEAGRSFSRSYICAVRIRMCHFFVSRYRQISADGQFGAAAAGRVYPCTACVATHTRSFCRYISHHLRLRGRAFALTADPDSAADHEGMSVNLSTGGCHITADCQGCGSAPGSEGLRSYGSSVIGCGSHISADRHLGCRILV